MTLSLQHLHGLDGVSEETISGILDLAEHFKRVNERRVKKVPALRSVLVVNFFVENSTRTRSSFEIAEKRLSADTLNFNAKSSSLSKGETLIDTARNLQAMSPDILVMRHPAAGAPGTPRRRGAHRPDLSLRLTVRGRHRHRLTALTATSRQAVIVSARPVRAELAASSGAVPKQPRNPGRLDAAASTRLAHLAHLASRVS